MNCDFALRALPLYYYGELSPEEEERFEEHVDGCAGCRAEMERQRAVLAALDRRQVAVAPDLLASCRHDLMRAVYRDEAPAAHRQGHSPWELFRAGFEALFPPVARLRVPVAAMALVAVGFFAARLTMRTPTGPSGLGITGLAAEPVVSSVRSVQPDEAGRVRLVLDETHRRVVSGSLEDRGIQSLLLAAARDESNPAVRVESVDILRAHPASTEIRAALLQALAADPNAAVRLKALEGLKPYASDPDVRKILAEVLLKDENPGVRIQVVDMLVQHRDDSMVGVLQNLVEKDNNGYVRLRCEKALREMNASVGTF